LQFGRPFLGHDCGIMPGTFSIVASDARTGEIGIGVQSKFLSVGAVVPFVRAGAGAIATQAFANTAYGPKALDLLQSGMPPDRVAEELAAADDSHQERQFGIVDCNGRAASFTGSRCIEWAGGIAADGFAAQGNILAGPGVVKALAETFAAQRGCLADRIIAALRAAQTAGGDKRGQQSAALIIEKRGGGYAGFNDRYVDLRVDDHAQPIEELARLLELHKLYFFPAEPQDVLEIDGALGAEISEELLRVGAIDRAGAYDERTHEALIAFMHVENLENRVLPGRKIDRQTLEYLRSFKR
jgi:uncharacterized Ntn-hydrolase superfamily protein